MNVQTFLNCPVCNSQSQLVAKDMEGYQEGDFYNLYECLGCDVTFIDPTITNFNIYNLIYKHSKEIRGYFRYEKIARNILKKKNPMEYLTSHGDTYWAINNILKTNIRKEADRILEVGCGYGYLTFALAQAGYDITGLDISQEAIDRATKTYGSFYICKDIFTIEETNENNYNCIILTEVLEHVADPVRFLKKLKSLLLPNGKIVLTTPNKDAYNGVDVWCTDYPPIHTFWFSEDCMRKIAGIVGLTVSFLDFSHYNKAHFDIAKVSPKSAKGGVFFDRNGHLKNSAKATFFLKSIYFVMDAFPALIRLMSYIRMKPFRKGVDWHRRNFMCVTLQSQA